MIQLIIINIINKHHLNKMIIFFWYVKVFYNERECKFHLILIIKLPLCFNSWLNYKKLCQIDAIFIAVVSLILCCKRYILRILLKILISEDLKQIY